MHYQTTFGILGKRCCAGGWHLKALDPEEVLTPTGPFTASAAVRTGSADPKVFSKTQYQAGFEPKSGKLTISNSKDVIVSRICKYLGMTRLIAVHWALS